MPVKKKAAKAAASRRVAKAPPKARAEPRNGKNPTAAASADKGPAKPPPESRNQYNAFERAIQLFRKQQFAQAREWFLKAQEGPAKEIKANAELHVRMCDRRLQSAPPAPRSLEEHYTYGVALLNSRQADQARRYLEAALRLDPRAEHVHYALGVCLALSGDLQGAYDSLKRAIELQPRNRVAARHDPDLEEFAQRPPLQRLLYPDSA
ncbi:MAG: tetratricopeptide repeat protein [Acidobacteria bacterium]|nr:tetratricopeptide repeat protein [Acidobacteriota bacterium]